MYRMVYMKDENPLEILVNLQDYSDTLTPYYTRTSPFDYLVECFNPCPAEPGYALPLQTM